MSVYISVSLYVCHECVSRTSAESSPCALMSVYIDVRLYESVCMSVCMSVPLLRVAPVRVQ